MEWFLCFPKNFLSLPFRQLCWLPVNERKFFKNFSKLFSIFWNDFVKSLKKYCQKMPLFMLRLNSEKMCSLVSMYREGFIPNCYVRTLKALTSHCDKWRDSSVLCWSPILLADKIWICHQEKDELIELIDLTIEDKAKNTLQSVPPDERCETS